MRRPVAVAMLALGLCGGAASGAIRASDAVFDAGAIQAADIGSAQIRDAHLDRATVNKIQIRDADILRAGVNKLRVTDADIVSLTADKIQAGTISASISMTSPSITVTAAQFTVNIDPVNAIKVTNPLYVSQLGVNGVRVTGGGGAYPWADVNNLGLIVTDNAGGYGKCAVDNGVHKSYLQVQQLRDCGYQAAYSVGSMVYRVPLYTSGGVLLGYIPVHNAS